MATADDLSLANQAGNLFRAELNAIVLALGTGFADADEPATTYPNLWWLDLTANRWKRRNNANDAWVDIGPIDSLVGWLPVSTHSTGQTAAATDRGELFDYTAAGVTHAFAAASALGAGWFCAVRNSAASGDVTLDPNSTEQIDGAATLVLKPGESVLVACTGSAFRTVGRLKDMVGDSGSGGQRGAVPAPAAGDAAAGKFWKADGTWAVPAAGEVGSYLWYAGLDTPTGYLECDGAAVSRATYANLFAKLVKSATITVTIASPGVVTWTGHGLKNGWPVKFSTTGALPAGIVAGTTYYIRNKATNTFQLSATPSGAIIDTTGSQSGVHTGICAPHGDGNGSTTFNTPDRRERIQMAAGDFDNPQSRVTEAISGIKAATLGATGGDQRLHQHQHLSPDGQAFMTFPGAGTGNTGSGIFTQTSNATQNAGSGAAQNMPPVGVDRLLIKH